MKHLLGLILLSSSLSSYACPISADQFVQNHQRVANIEARAASPASPILTEKEFYKFRDNLLKEFSPNFARIGRVLKIDASWKDPELNAYAAQKGNESWIYLSGGYARAAYMSRDAYYTVVCHELGHHLGGFPRKNGTWASAEGQADYYSTAKCMKQMMKFDPNNRRLAQTLKLPAEIKQLCRKAHKTEDDYFVCLRSAKAAEDYGQMIQYRRTNQDPTQSVNLMLRDPRQVTQTNINHPEAQCRLDTKLEGALCNIHERVTFNANEEEQGACTPSKGYQVGVRPACWFARSR